MLNISINDENNNDNKVQINKVQINRSQYHDGPSIQKTLYTSAIHIYIEQVN